MKNVQRTVAIAGRRTHNDCGALLGGRLVGEGDRNMGLREKKEPRGDRQGDWTVKVSGNWRVTFRFVGKDADAVNCEDYH